MKLDRDRARPASAACPASPAGWAPASTSSSATTRPASPRCSRRSARSSTASTTATRPAPRRPPATSASALGGGLYRGALYYEVSTTARDSRRGATSPPPTSSRSCSTARGRRFGRSSGAAATATFPSPASTSGMPRSVFESCAFISAGRCLRGRQERHPQRSATPSPPSPTPAAATSPPATPMDRLDAALSKVGSRLVPALPSSPSRATAQNRARDELAAADTARSAVAEKARSWSACRRASARLAEERARTEYALHAARAARLRKRIARRREPPTWRSPPPQLGSARPLPSISPR